MKKCGMLETRDATKPMTRDDRQVSKMKKVSALVKLKDLISPLNVANKADGNRSSHAGKIR